MIFFLLKDITTGFTGNVLTESNFENDKDFWITFIEIQICYWVTNKDKHTIIIKRIIVTINIDVRYNKFTTCLRTEQHLRTLISRGKKPFLSRNVLCDDVFMHFWYTLYDALQPYSRPALRHVLCWICCYWSIPLLPPFSMTWHNGRTTKTVISLTPDSRFSWTDLKDYAVWFAAKKVECVGCMQRVLSSFMYVLQGRGIITAPIKMRVELLYELSPWFFVLIIWNRIPASIKPLIVCNIHSFSILMLHNSVSFQTSYLCYYS